MPEVRIIHPNERETEVSSGEMTRIAGVSESLTGATGIHLAIASIQPGCSSGAHVHLNCESALLVLRGHGKFMVGENLDQAIEFGPGDYLFVPPDAPHQPVNDGDEVVELVVARNTPVEIVRDYSPKGGA
ncbi:MAG: cupin domain-containing protein [Gammaproteobacteria bacterium]|nr:cupin domain-containing protein [Gammaproteobacteria bacterium]